MRLAVPVLAIAAVLLGLVPRVLLATGTAPEPLRAFTWSDALFVYERGLRGHRLPYLDTPFEYPPLVGLATGLFSLIASDGAAFVALWGMLAAACAGVIAWLLTQSTDPRRVVLRFALAPQLVLLGSLNFDLLAVAFLVCALTAARARHDGRTALWLGFGTASKLFPLAAAPIAALRAARPWRTGSIVAGVVAACFLPAIAAGSSAGASPLYYLVGIEANIDSPWGLAARLGRVLGVADAQSIVTLVTLAGLAVTYVRTVAPRARASDGVAGFGLAIVATLLWSRLYSPQYSLWLLPFFVLLPIPGRVFALFTAGDLLVFLSISPLTLVNWRAGDPTQLLVLATLVVGIGLRLAGLLGTWQALRRVTVAGQPI